APKRHPERLTQVDFLAPNVIDGYAPITRLAARIKDLRDDGHEIVVDGERYSCAVYKLPQAEPVPIPRSEPPTTEELQGGDALFVLPSRSAIFDEDAA